MALARLLRGSTPVVLWAHDANLPPIGRAVSLEIVPGVGLWAENEFAPTPFAIELFELYRGGFLNAFSVGFRPLETEKRRDRDGQRGTTILRWELVEQSAVAVPANPDALVDAAAAGNKAADWLLKTYYPVDPARGRSAAGWVPIPAVAPAVAAPTATCQGAEMQELITELRAIADQIQREHDPERMQKAIRDVVTTQQPGATRLAGLDAAGSDEPGTSLKGLMVRPARTSAEHELQRLNDRVYLSSVLLRRDPRSLKSYGEFQRLGGELRKAMNSIDNSIPMHSTKLPRL